MARLESINIEGVLEKSFSLGFVAERSAVGFPVELHHTIATSRSGTASSVWAVSGVISYCVAREDGTSEWLSTNGDIVIFNRTGLPNAPDANGLSEDLKLVNLDATHLEVANGEGVTFRYEKGSLVSIKWSADVFPVKSTGCLIESVSDPSGRRIFEVQRSESGAVERLRIENDVFAFYYTEGRLDSFSKNTICPVRFAYSEGLVSQITESGRSDSFLWQRIERKSDQRLWRSRYGVTLIEDSAFRYNFSIGSKGTAIEARRKADKKISSLVYHTYSKTFTELTFDGQRSDF